MHSEEIIYTPVRTCSISNLHLDKRAYDSIRELCQQFEVSKAKSLPCVIHHLTMNELRPYRDILDLSRDRLNDMNGLEKRNGSVRRGMTVDVETINYIDRTLKELIDVLKRLRGRHYDYFQVMLINNGGLNFED